MDSQTPQTPKNVQRYLTVLEADWNYPPHIQHELRDRSHNVDGMAQSSTLWLPR